MLLPTSVVAINFEGSLIKRDKIRAGKKPWLLSNSMRNLLLVKKAISSPAKNADDNNDNMITILVWLIINNDSSKLIFKIIDALFVEHKHYTTKKRE